MIDILMANGWIFHEKGCSTCGGGPREKWKNAAKKDYSITIFPSRNTFKVKFLKRWIKDGHKNQLDEYLKTI